MYAVILAGGKGKRLWPVSTSSKPKQLISLLGNGTMLQQTVRRILPIVSPDRIFVVTDESIISEVVKQLEEIPKQNLIVEPIGRNTLPCVALASLHIARRYSSDEVIAVFPSDHIIQNEPRFREAMRVAEKIALDIGALVMIGIKPNRPETGYGYIQIGNLVKDRGNIRVFNAGSFIEKPDKERATEFLKTDQHLWNSGIFVWKISTFMKAIEAHAPDIYERLSSLEASIGISDENTVIEEIYPKLRSISIDYGIMEKASNIVVVEADIGWNDVGNWTAFEHIGKKDENSNTCMGHHFGIDTK